MASVREWVRRRFMGYLGLAVLLVCAMVASPAAAQCPNCGRPQYPVAQAVRAVPGYTAAAAKAARNATYGIISRASHRGAMAGQYEGTGFSTVSAERAIAVACYANDPRFVRTSVAVVRGPRGYHAVVGYAPRR